MVRNPRSWIPDRLVLTGCAQSIRGPGGELKLMGQLLGVMGAGFSIARNTR